MNTNTQPSAPLSAPINAIQTVPLMPVSDRKIQMLLGTIPEYFPGGNLSLFIQKVDKLMRHLAGRLTPTLDYIVQDTIQLRIKAEAETYIVCLNLNTWEESKKCFIKKIR